MSQQRTTSNSDQQPSRFLPESAPPPSHHYHDAFGDGDAGVDYGDPLDLEEGGYDSVDSDDAHVVDSAAAAATRQNDAAIDLVNHTVQEPATTSLDELYEEVGLHETTLSTLHSKLTALTSQIEAEEALALTIREEIQLLAKKKVILKKKTEGNLEMVKRVEGTLEKTLGRLRAALGREGEIKEAHNKIQHDINEEKSEIDGDNSSVQQYLLPDLENVDGDLEQTEEFEAKIDEQDDGKEMPTSSYIEIPLHLDSIQTIHWPATDDMQSEIKSIIPKWRTNLPSPSLWNIDSADLLMKLMNITALENLLERQHLINEGLLSSDVGWIKESCIQGTPLDIYTHVNCKSWLKASQISVMADTNLDLPKETIDPNAVLCPYELAGTCADDRCPYQHLDRRPPENLITLSDGRRFLRYDLLPEPKLPSPLSIDDFISGKELLSHRKSDVDGKKATHSEQKPSTKVYPCPTCAKISLSPDDLRAHMKQCNRSTLVVDGTQYIVQNILVDEKKGEPVDHAKKNVANHESGSLDELVGDASDFTENHDLVRLPTVADNFDFESSDDESIVDIEKPLFKSSLFSDQFWWQHLMPLLGKERFASCDEKIDLILLSFGFQPIRDDFSGDGISQISLLQCSKARLESNKSVKPQVGKSRELEEIFLFARIVDVCQICVHMGHYHLGLSLLRGVSRSKETEYHVHLLQHALDSLKAITYSHSACDVFTCQARLRIISEFYRIRYAWLARSNSKPGEQPCLDKSLAFLLDTSTTSGHDIIMHLKSRMPSEDSFQYGWEKFDACLQLQLEKNIMVPLSYKMTEAEELSFILDCAVIGQTLQELAISINDESFNPMTQLLEPVWSTIQRLFNKSITYQLEGKSDNSLNRQMLAIILVGPIIFACASKIILPRSYQVLNHGEKFMPGFDSRRRLDLLALDKFIVEVIKDIRRHGRNQTKCGNIEPLLAPVSALSTAICVSLASFDKAQMRLENALNSKNKIQGQETPSLQVISAMLWSQFVHLRMNCPSFDYLMSLDTDEWPGVLHSNIIERNGEFASSTISNGTIICGLSSCGDRPMISAAVSNSADRLQWQNLVSFAAENYPSNMNRFREERTLNNNNFEFNVSNPELNRMSIAEFPLSVFVAGQSLTNLCLVGCMLDRLPVSSVSECCLQLHRLCNKILLLCTTSLVFIWESSNRSKGK